MTRICFSSGECWCRAGAYQNPAEPEGFGLDLKRKTHSLSLFFFLNLESTVTTMTENRQSQPFFLTLTIMADDQVYFDDQFCHLLTLTYPKTPFQTVTLKVLSYESQYVF